jgi:dTMP kinase
MSVHSEDLEAVGWMVRHRGKLIAIEGIDQAGKRTQAHLLATKFRRMGRPVSVWSFPDYRTPVGKQLRAYLKRRIRLDPHTVHLLYAANKWEVADKLTNRLEHGDVVIVNRYTPSNLVYGVAHGLPHDWLASLEEQLPKPDVVVVLDVSPRTSLRRKHRGRDVHESDLQYLSRVRRTYRSLARKYDWAVVEGRMEPGKVGRIVWERAVASLR